MIYKQPRSIQVVIFTHVEGQREFLLLKRQESYGGFWQTVTGSLEDNETHKEAAVREVSEETGIVCHAEELIDLHLTNVFEIAPQWRAKFAPDATHNEEVCFALKVHKGDVRLDDREHESFAWLDYQRAFGMLYWDSSKKAFEALTRLEGVGE